MLICNLDPQNGHVNGNRYIVKKITNYVHFSLTVTKMCKRKKLTLPQSICAPCEEPFSVPSFKPLQILIFFFVITTNKAQENYFEENL